MVVLKRFLGRLIGRYPWKSAANFDLKQLGLSVVMMAGWFLFNGIVIYVLFHSTAYASGSGSLPSGTDETGQLTAAATLLNILDVGIFKWGARLFAGLCIMSSAWALKEQRFGVAVICIVGAILFGTAPKWVANLFAIGGNQGIFSQSSSSYRPERKYFEV